MATTTWTKSTSGDWLPFETFNVGNVSTFGVYVIWHGAGYNIAPWTVRVGQGNVKDRILQHRADSAILAHRAKGGLWVTWAAVLPSDANGVERYLADQLRPLVGDRHPDVAPIAVNLPWAA
jgi:hypothetical protein